MASLEFAGDSGSLSDINATQGEFRGQIAALNDLTRQIVGDASTESGSSNPIDPLSAPFVLYVNAYTGSDTFVTGSYNSYDDGSIESKRKIVENQRLVCGYSPQRPFRTINRAIIEAAIITSKDYFEETSGSPYEGDLVSIVLMPGLIDALNGPGSTVSAEWTDGKNPTDNELEAFNPTSGGIILPRGCSLCSLDLRKCIVRPTSVPAVADEAADYSNRRAIFKMTGRGYYYGITFKDEENASSSHHLVDCFQFASAADLDAFYSKIRIAFGGANNTGNISNTLAVKRDSEWKIVGTFPADGSQTITSDTTQGASPYIYNCSIRSQWGLCGVFADGAQVNGLRSCVIAQFTGVSLQRDLNCWQKYSGTSWGSFSDYADYIDTDPDNTRMDPDRRSFHIRAVNDAIIQEVSVFAIGQGVHHWVQNGGEITITNSNSNFGGVAALAEGYQDESLPSDVNWSVGEIRVASDMSDEANNVRRMFLGVIDSGVANNATTITLTAELAESSTIDGVPDLLARDGYTFRENSLLWVENPAGRDFYATLPSSAWSPSTPDQITVNAAFVNQDGESPDGSNNLPDLAGSRVYIRRLTDTRTVDERTYSLLLNNTDATSRTPLRDYILQTNVNSAAIDSEIPDTAILTVSRSAPKTPVGAGVERSAQIELRRNNATNAWATSTYYRLGDVVQYNNKHWIATADHTSGAAFDTGVWDENFVHMEEGYKPEDFSKNVQPLVVFDDDTDQDEDSSDLGWFAAGRDWDDNAELQQQYRTATDYKGLHSFLVSLGFSSANAHTILLPKPNAQRYRDPGSALDGISAPSGAANSWDNWAVQMRRPSNMRLFGHAWEWAGFLNYTKALPKYQGELSPSNKFTYYFTNQNGGRVYASGFNEEGFAISPAGLQNIETGEVLPPQEIGSGDREINDPPTFNTAATNSTQGLVKIASNAQVQSALNGSVVGDSDGFELVVKVDDIPEIVDASLARIGLLEDADTDYYVATSISDVSDSHVAADGATTGDARTTAARKTALYCASIAVAFNKINNRTSITGRPITIHLYTSTTTASSASYSGESEIIFENQDGSSDSISAQHTVGSITFNANSSVYFKNVSLALSVSYIRQNSGGTIYVYGGRYETTFTSNTFHYVFFALDADLEMYLKNQVTGSSADLTIVNGGSNSTAEYFNGLAQAKRIFIDTRYNTGDSAPTLTTTMATTGNTAHNVFRARTYFQFYSGTGAGNDAYVFNWNVSCTTSATEINVFQPFTDSVNTVFNFILQNNACTTSVSIPNSIDTFRQVYFDEKECIVRDMGFTNAQPWNTMLTQAVSDSSGLSNSGAYYYVVGAVSNVNNTFKETGEEKTLAGTTVL